MLPHIPTSGSWRQSLGKACREAGTKWKRSFAYARSIAYSWTIALPEAPFATAKPAKSVAITA